MTSISGWLITSSPTAIPLRAKREAFLAFQHYRAYARTKHNLEIGALQDDKGGKYMPKEFDTFCADHGIVRRHTVRNRPQQNGVAERFNRLLGERITTMLAESHLPLQFWEEVFLSTTGLLPLPCLTLLPLRCGRAPSLTCLT